MESNEGVAISRRGQKISSIDIESVRGIHRGVYVCYAKNRAGITSFSAQLAINGDQRIRLDKTLQFFD